MKNLLRKFRLLPLLLLVSALSFVIRVGDFVSSLNNMGAAQAQEEVSANPPPLPAPGSDAKKADDKAPNEIRGRYDLDAKGDDLKLRPEYQDKSAPAPASDASKPADALKVTDAKPAGVKSDAKADDKKTDDKKPDDSKSSPDKSTDKDAKTDKDKSGDPKDQSKTADADKKPDAKPANWKDSTDSDAEDSPVKSELYKDLAKRRDDLDKREKELAVREALLSAAEREVDQKLKELTTLRGEIEGAMKKRSAEEDAHINSLVKIYEGMKPKDAAAIFNTLDLDVLQEIMTRMNERKTSPILALMSPDRAKTITIMMAQRKDAPALPPANN